MRSRSAVVRANPNITSTTDQFFPPPQSAGAPVMNADSPKSLPKAPSLQELANADQAAHHDATEPDYDFPVLSNGFDRIVSRVYNIDSEKEYDELVTSLKSSERPSRSDYGTLVDALDVAEDCARRAMALYVNGKVTDVAFELDSLAITGAMRKEAVEKLNADKFTEDGKPIKGTKMITEADVTGYMASQWSDQYRRIELDRAKSKSMVSYLERLAELWKQRARDLSTMVSNARQ